LGPGQIPEIVELQRHTEIGFAQQRNHFLQIITLLAGHPHLLALDRDLHLELRLLDHFHELAAGIDIEAMLQRYFLLHHLAGSLQFAFLDCTRIDLALDQRPAQDVEHLLELDIGLGTHCDHPLLALEFRIHPLEIETIADDPAGLVDGVGQRMQIHFGNHVK